MVLLLDPDPVAAMEIAYEALNALESRIEALEQAQTSVDCERVHRDMAEDERQDRWHATYNAALPECIRQLIGVNTDSERAERAHVMAVSHANRVHGTRVPKPAAEPEP
jgi:hypothetical protein